MVFPELLGSVLASDTLEDLLATCDIAKLRSAAKDSSRCWEKHRNWVGDRLNTYQGGRPGSWSDRRHPHRQ